MTDPLPSADNSIPNANSTFEEEKPSPHPSPKSRSPRTKRRKLWLCLGLSLLVLLLIILTIVFVLIYYQSSRDRAPVSTRLDRSLIPIKYELDLKTYIPSADQTLPHEKRTIYAPDLNFTFDGNVSILVKCVSKSIDTILLNAKKLNISRRENVRVERVRDGRSIEVLDVAVLSDLEQLRISLGEYLDEDSEYRIFVSYRGEHGSDLSGFYRSSYVEKGVMRWMVVTQFQPTAARKALPCFDEPDMKAVFVVRLTHPANMVALSNMMEEGREDIEDNWAVTRFRPSPKMSTYVLALFVSEFEYRSSRTSNGIMFRVWARPSQIRFADYASQIGPRILEYFEEYFKIPFPLQKQDMIALPDFDAGAMENWGLITYREIYLLWSPRFSMGAYRQRIAEIIAHELAHQWFGNLVTMKWWDDIWLNEGFATYMQYLGADFSSQGEYRMNEQFVPSAIQASMEMDQLGSSHPLHVAVANPVEIFQIFDRISYEKGASVLRMLQSLVGEETFRRALTQYLNRYQYGNADHKDMWNAITEAVQNEGTTRDWDDQPLNVTEFMEHWTEQMGFPLITVTRGDSMANLRLAQSRFKLYDNPDSARFANPKHAYVWNVPVWYQVGGAGGSSGQTWLRAEKNGYEAMFNLTERDAEKWFLLNPGVRGFYRVNYDEANWQKLSDQLRIDHEKIDVGSRSQLLDDAFTLAKSGHLAYRVPFELTKYLANENAAVPWTTITYNFEFLKEMLQHSANSSSLKRYASKLVEPLYHRIGIERKGFGEEDVVKSKLRFLAWSLACEMELAHCKDSMRILFGHFKQSCPEDEAASSDCNPIAPTLRQTMYCEGTMQGDEDDWAFLWNKYVREDVSWEKSNLMVGLCCSKDLAILERILDKAIGGEEIRMSEVGVVFINVARNPMGTKILWKYVSQNWPLLKSRFDGTSTLGALVKAATHGFNTDEQLEMLKSFMQSQGGDFGTSETAFEQQLEQTKTNIEWMKRNERDALDWFIRQI